MQAVNREDGPLDSRKIVRAWRRDINPQYQGNIIREGVWKTLLKNEGNIEGEC